MKLKNNTFTHWTQRHHSHKQVIPQFHRFPSPLKSADVTVLLPEGFSEKVKRIRKED